MILYEAYCDETGSDGKSPLLAVGGYLVTPQNARQLEAEWTGELLKHQMPYFHMVDVAHGSGVYRDMDRDKRIKLQVNLFQIINRHVEIAFAFAIPLHRFEKSAYGEQAAYTLCLNHGLAALQSLLSRKHGNQYGLSVYYESGHKHAAQAQQIFQATNFVQDRPNFSFINKQDSGMIQAADVLVWQYGKFIKDLVSGGRVVRKDFQQLMKRPAVFFNVVPSNEAYAIMTIYDEHLNGSAGSPSNAEGVGHDLGVIRRMYSPSGTLRDIFQIAET